MEAESFFFCRSAGPLLKKMEFNDFLKKKYRAYFNFLDIFNEGSITKATFDQICENLCRAYKACPESVEMLKSEVPKWWIHYQDIARNGKVTMQQYLDVIQSCFSNPATFQLYKDNVVRGNEIVFSIIDANKDGNISVQELRKYYSAFGCADEKFLDKVFRTIDTNKNGLISKEEFTDIFYKYFFIGDIGSGCEYLFDWSEHKN